MLDAGVLWNVVLKTAVIVIDPCYVIMIGYSMYLVVVYSHFLIMITYCTVVTCSSLWIYFGKLYTSQYHVLIRIAWEKSQT